MEKECTEECGHYWCKQQREDDNKPPCERCQECQESPEPTDN